VAKGVKGNLGDFCSRAAVGFCFALLRFLLALPLCFQLQLIIISPFARSVLILLALIYNLYLLSFIFYSHSAAEGDERTCRFCPLQSSSPTRQILFTLD
jgi:hypothetical protein